MKVELRGVTKRFPSRDKKNKEQVVAVDNFSFEFPDGKLIALLGPSGCGKSTVLNMISGLLAPSSGEIFFGEENVTFLSPEERGVGMVFQSYALYPHMTVMENIMFPLGNFKGKEKLSKSEMEKKAREIASLVEISSLLERKPKELSGGQQQRVAIARALIKKPRVLLLDEPLSNLDARLRLQTREEIKRIQSETKITTIFVTHDQEEAMSISDEIVVMKNGRINQTGKSQEVYDSPENLFVAKFLGTPQINVFNGKIKNGRLYIGDEDLLDVNVSDREVFVGIRPEGFSIEERGNFTLGLNRVEVMGRDTSIIMNHPMAEGMSVRGIVMTEDIEKLKGNSVKVFLKKEKVLIFDKETEERIEALYE